MSDGSDGKAKSRVHVPALDGLRGVAIALVLLIHFCLYLGMTDTTPVDRVVHRVFLGGWVGVDLFFTLSGYLITGILLDTLHGPSRGRRPLYNFYGRRFLRIFPPYYLFLTIYLVIVAHLLPPPFFAPELPYQAWYWTYTSNVRAALYGWKDPVLAHFWSLAVEEQFYVVWPFVVLLCERATLKRVAIAMIVIALGLRVTCWALKMPEAAYVLTPCRMDSLASGALIAILQREEVPAETMLRWAKRLGVVACLGIGGITIARGVFTHFDAIVYTLGITFVAAGSAALVIAACFAGPETRIQRLLAGRGGAWLRGMGKVSYGMYILHVPILCLLLVAKLDLRNARPLGGNLAPWLVIDTVAGGGLIYLLALASWHIYEKRLLGLKRYFAD